MYTGRKVADLRILGHTVELFETTNLLRDGKTYGEWIYAELGMYVDAGVVPGVKQESFCHEVTESWNDFAELKLPHNKIQLIGNCLFQFLMDNDPYLFLRRQSDLKSIVGPVPNISKTTHKT